MKYTYTNYHGTLSKLQRSNKKCGNILIDWKLVLLKLNLNTLVMYCAFYGHIILLVVYRLPAAGRLSVGACRSRQVTTVS